MFAQFLLMPVKSYINNLSTNEWRERKKKENKPTTNRWANNVSGKRCLEKDWKKRCIFNSRRFAFPFVVPFRRCNQFDYMTQRRKTCSAIVATSSVVKTFVQRTASAQCTHSTWNVCVSKYRYGFVIYINPHVCIFLAKYKQIHVIDEVYVYY